LVADFDAAFPAGAFDDFAAPAVAEWCDEVVGTTRFLDGTADRVPFARDDPPAPGFRECLVDTDRTLPPRPDTTSSCPGKMTSRRMALRRISDFTDV